MSTNRFSTQLSHTVDMLKKIRRRWLYLGIFVFLLLENALFAYNNLQNRTAIVGLRFEHRNLTGLTRQQIETVIAEEAAKRRQPLRLRYKGKEYQILPEAVGYTVDPSYITNKLLQTGRTGTMLQKFVIQQTALLGFQNEHIQGTYSQSLLLLQVKQLQEAFDQEPQVETLDFSHNIQTVIPARDGVKIQVDKLMLLLVKILSHPAQTPLPLPTYTAFASIHPPQELDPIRQLAPTLIARPISITSAGSTFTLTSDDLRSMLVVVERPDPQKPGKTKLVLHLDDKKLNQKLGIFAAPLEMQMRAEFNDEDAKVAILSQFFSGKRDVFDIPMGHNLAKNFVLGAQTQSQRGTPIQQNQQQATPKVAYLTFDDGPNAIYHPMILDILKTYNVKATFFLIGQNTKRDSDIAKRTVAEGHLIGDHSLTHSFLPNLSSKDITNELQTTDSILKGINNNDDITLFRPPYGGINNTVRFDAHTLGLKIFLWDVDPQDWSEPPVDELVRRVVTATQDGSNILMHSNHLATVRALPRIIESLKAEGFTFRTLDQYPQQEED